MATGGSDQCHLCALPGSSWLLQSSAHFLYTPADFSVQHMLLSPTPTLSPTPPAALSCPGPEDAVVCLLSAFPLPSWPMQVLCKPASPPGTASSLVPSPSHSPLRLCHFSWCLVPLATFWTPSFPAPLLTLSCAQCPPPASSHHHPVVSHRVRGSLSSCRAE